MTFYNSSDNIFTFLVLIIFLSGQNQIILFGGNWNKLPQNSNGALFEKRTRKEPYNLFFSVVFRGPGIGPI